MPSPTNTHISGNGFLRIVAAGSAVVVLVLGGCGTAAADVPVGPGPTEHRCNPSPRPERATIGRLPTARFCPIRPVPPARQIPRSPRTPSIPPSAGPDTRSRFGRRGRSPRPKRRPARPRTVTPALCRRRNTTTWYPLRSAVIRTIHATSGWSPAHRQPRRRRRDAVESTGLRAKGAVGRGAGGDRVRLDDGAERGGLRGRLVRPGPWEGWLSAGLHMAATRGRGEHPRGTTVLIGKSCRRLR